MATKQIMYFIIFYPAIDFQFFLKKIFFNVYFWERDRQRTSGGGAEREGDTESEAGSRIWAVSTELNAELKPTNCEVMTYLNLDT